MAFLTQAHRERPWLREARRNPSRRPSSRTSLGTQRDSVQEFSSTTPRLLARKFLCGFAARYSEETFSAQSERGRWKFWEAGRVVDSEGGGGRTASGLNRRATARRAEVASQRCGVTQATVPTQWPARRAARGRQTNQPSAPARARRGAPRACLSALRTFKLHWWLK